MAIFYTVVATSSLDVIAAQTLTWKVALYSSESLHFHQQHSLWDLESSSGSSEELEQLNQNFVLIFNDE